MPEVVRSAAIDLPPDWVCESLSSGSTAAFDKAVKMPVYAKAGVKHLWLVDTDNFTVEVFRLQKKQWLLVKVFAGAVKVRAEPFDAVELDLTPLWVK